MRYHTLPLLAAGLLAASLPAARAEAEDSVSSSTPAPASNGRLTLNITKDREDSRVGMDWSLRWDFRDLLSLRPSVKTLTSGVKALASWDITENTRVNYYGLRTNPWRLVLSDKKKAARPRAAGGAAGSAGGGIVDGRPSAGRRVRLSFSPLIDDLKRSIDEDLGDLLLKESLKGSEAGTAWQKAGRDGRREFVRDVLSLGVWDSGLPVLREGRAGLQFLGGSGGNGLKPAPQSITITTAPAAPAGAGD